MIWYRLRKKSPSDRDYLWTNPDERLYFKKEGLSIHVGTFYQTVEAAEKARQLREESQRHYTQSVLQASTDHVQVH